MWAAAILELVDHVLDAAGVLEAMRPVLRSSHLGVTQCDASDTPSDVIHSFSQDQTSVLVELWLEDTTDAMAVPTTWLGSHTHVHVTNQNPAQHTSLAMDLKQGDVLLSDPMLLRRWRRPQLPAVSILRCFLTQKS